MQSDKKLVLNEVFVGNGNEEKRNGMVEIWIMI